jgi:hypothetical protein
MKKNLLLAAAALFAGTSAFAQAIVIDGAALNLSSDLSDVAAGTVIGSNDGIELAFAFDDQYKIVDLKQDGYTSFIINGEEIPTTYGVQGNANPKDGEGGNPALTLTAPIQGAVLQITAKQDGYVAVWGKLSSNKNYTVFEEGTAVGYRLVMQTANETLGKIDITIEGEGELNQVKQQIAWPEVIVTGDENSAIKVNGDGVILFPVYKECVYLVNACGSKISAGGAYFSTTNDINVSIAGDGVETVARLGDVQAGGESGIASINGSAKVSSVKIYNVSGQEVKSLVKGINIVKRTMSDGSVQCVKVLNK